MARFPRPERESGGKPVKVKPHTRKPPKRRPPPAPAARPPRPSVDPLAGIYGPAETYVNSLLAKLKAEQAAKAANAQGAYASYAKWYGEHAPQQIQGIYSNAAQNQTGFAKGFSDGMQAIQQQTASQDNALLSHLNAPEGQMQHPGPEAGNVVYGLGGWNPANTLNQQGAAFASAAALQGPAILAQGRQAAADASKGYDSQIEDLTGKLVDLKSKKAEARYKIREAAREAKAKAAAERSKALADAGKPHRISTTLSAAYGILMDDYGNPIRGRDGKPIPYVPYEKPSRSGSSRSGSSSKGGTSTSSNRYYVIQTADGMYRVDKRTGRMTKLKGGAADPASGGASFTPLQLNRFRAEANAFLKDAMSGFTDKGGYHPPLSYEEAIAEAATLEVPPEIVNPLIAKAYGMKNVGGRMLYTAQGLRRFSVNTLGHIARTLGWSPDPNRPLTKQGFVKWILGAQGKGSAAPSGGRQNAAFVQGNAVLPATFEATHETDGLPGYPAVDYMLPAGTTVGAPTSGRIFRVHHTQPGNPKVYGWIVYLQADNGDIYFLTHFDNVFVRDGQRVQRGSALGTVAPYGSASHIHIGIHRNRSV